MEYTNEFLARVYGAYIGSNIIMPKSGRIAKLQGVDFDGATIHLNDGEDHRNFEYFPFKLILTPLSEISDEDAIEVAKMIDNGYTGKDKTSVRRSGNTLYVNTNEVDDVCLVRISTPPSVFNITVMHEDTWNTTGRTMQKVVDYLRSNKRPDGTEKPVYDCGYGEIPSLIKAGIAIKNQQPISEEAFTFPAICKDCGQNMHTKVANPRCGKITDSSCASSCPYGLVALGSTNI